MAKSKIISAVVLTVMGFFLIYQLYSVFYNPISTEIVEQFSTTEGIDINGVIIRDEQIISGDTSAALHFEVADGSRVAKNGVIAYVYSDASQSLAAARAAQIEKEIESIEEIQKYNDLNAVDTELINNKFFSYFADFSAKAVSGNFAFLSEDKNEMLSLINRKQIATGKTIDFSSKLSALKAELAAYRAKTGTPKSSINSPESGYFVASADGYENLLNTDNLSAITPEFLNGLSPAAVDTDKTVGKLVSNYTWYIAANVSVNDSLTFKVGERLNVKTNIKGSESISVAVHSVNVSPGSEGAVVIFSCNEMNAALSTVRTVPMRVVRKNYSGLKVSSKALRVVNESENGEDKAVTGVYVLTGMTAHFMPVKIIYSSDSYVLCEYLKDEGNLKLYDEIIVKGKNIYDGKIID